MNRREIKKNGLQHSCEMIHQHTSHSKRFFTHTLGCKVNQYETRALEELFEEAGYTKVVNQKSADVVLINTCTVTAISDRKSRQLIRKARKNNPHAVIVAAGCFAQMSPEEVANIEGVHVIVGTNHRERLIPAIEQIHSADQLPVSLVMDHETGEMYEQLSLKETTDKTRAYVKIQDGCDQYCSYCIIPHARGPVRSRDQQDVLEEIHRLIHREYQEIVLTGIHLGSYGKDHKNPKGLIHLLEEISTVKGLGRIRLGSLEPSLIRPEFVEMVESFSAICRHFHLSLQSGCDRTLKRMNRKYTVKDFQSAVERLRNMDPMVSITTDIIVGFPGETEEDFQETIAFVKKVRLSDIHVFRYSPRKGTPAASYGHQVPEHVKTERSKWMTEAAAELKKEYLKSFSGTIQRVLLESPVNDERKQMEGYTDHYVRVLVPYCHDALHRTVQIQITGVNDDHCCGEWVDAPKPVK